MQSGKLGGADQDMQIFAYVQTRGRVPSYWAEINSLRYTPKIQVRSPESAFTAARRHFDEQIRIYGDNYMINLVNSKGREKNIKDLYEKMVQVLVTAPKERTEADRLTDEKLHYVYFDFHTETKGMAMHKAYLLIERMANEIE